LATRAATAELSLIVRPVVSNLPIVPTDRPIVTLTTDFQSVDYYVAAIKGVLLSAYRDVCIVDVTHEIPRHDVVAGSIVLERALASFPPGTYHLVVVDPGVGSDRRIIIAEIAGQTVVCPDNGLITWAVRRLEGSQIHELIWRPAQSSATFEGRDLMAPALTMLMQGRPISEIGRAISDAGLLDLNLASDRRRGQIIHIDTYGNATTNLPAALLASRHDATVSVRGQSVGQIRHTYGDVGIGEPLALIGSSGLLEIAVREGDAAAEMNLKVGDAVALK